MRELEFANFALRRAAHARAAGAAVHTDVLQAALLGPAVRLLDGAPVVIVPPAKLHSAPWSLLPALAGVPVSVSASAAMWLRARAVAADPPADRRVVIILGPKLVNGGSEVSSIVRLHKESTVLGLETGYGAATIERVLAGMSGAWLAHIAAHGSFRADSPLLFAEPGQGAAVVHDLDRLTRAPHRVVLSACDSGVGAPVGADELLGTVSGLLRAGSAGVLASVVPVNDAAAAPFMVAVHRALLGGHTLPGGHPGSPAGVGRRSGGDGNRGLVQCVGYLVRQCPRAQGITHAVVILGAPVASTRIRKSASGASENSKRP